MRRKKVSRHGPVLVKRKGRPAHPLPGVPVKFEDHNGVLLAHYATGGHAMPGRAPAVDHYAKKLYYLWRTGALPEDKPSRIEIGHAPACAFLHGQRCNCDP